MAEKSLFIEIVTPQRVIFSGEAESVTVPGTKAPFQVLYNHAPIVSSLETGVVKIGKSDGTLWFAITNGFIEVQNNKISILVETAEEGGEIDLAAAQKELEKTIEDMKSSASAEEKNARQQKSLLAKAKIKAAEKAK